MRYEAAMRLFLTMAAVENGLQPRHRQGSLPVYYGLRSVDFGYPLLEAVHETHRGAPTGPVKFAATFSRGKDLTHRLLRPKLKTRPETGFSPCVQGTLCVRQSPE